MLPAVTNPSPFPRYQIDHCYDEMFDAAGTPRQPYEALYARLLELPPTEPRRRQQDADAAFLHEGITFTVYGDADGTQRIFPYDLLPWIIMAREWETIERGLTQRLTALNLFLADIYHAGRILAERVVPRKLVISSQHYRREMRGFRPPRDVYVSVAGADLVRLPNGGFAVLEEKPPRAERRLLHARTARSSSACSPSSSRTTRCGPSITTARRCSPRCGRSRRPTAAIPPSSC